MNDIDLRSSDKNFVEISYKATSTLSSSSSDNHNEQQHKRKKQILEEVRCFVFAVEPNLKN